MPTTPDPSITQLLAHAHAMGITHAKLATMCGIDRNHIYQLRTGRRQPSAATLRTIANGLGLDLAFIALNTTPKNISENSSKAT